MSHITVGDGPRSNGVGSDESHNATTGTTTITTTTTNTNTTASSSSNSNATIGNGRGVEFPVNSTEAKYLQKVLAMLQASHDSEGLDGTSTTSTGGSSGASGDNNMPEIIDGQVANQTEFPFMVLAEGAECGAVLVAKDVVMSAAHCQGVFGGKVLVGAYKRNSTVGGAQWRNVLSPMQIHPDNDPNFLYNDVMLFQIQPTTLEPVELNTDPSDPAVGDNLTVAGFGYYQNGRFVQPQYLRKATVQSLDNNICNSLWKSTGDFFGFETSFQPDLMTCTMGIYNDGDPIGSCNGDSGGPLLDKDGKQVGIVSWGGQNPFCSAAFLPDVYTRVSGVIDFVQEAICKLTSDPSVLPFTCPDFVCPPDTTVFGINDAVVPSASGKTRSFNGFTPVTVTQVPTAGSPLTFAQDSYVKVTATDVSGKKLTCKWKVTVPDLTVVGAVAVQLPKGRGSSRNALVMDNKAPAAVWEFNGFLWDGRFGPNGQASARLRVGSNTTTKAIVIGRFNWDVTLSLRKSLLITSRSNPRVLVDSKGMPNDSTILIYFIYGQQTDS